MIASGVIVFAGLVVAWWREWLGGLIVLLMVGVPTAISAVISCAQKREARGRYGCSRLLCPNIVDVDTSLLGAPHIERQHNYPQEAPPCPHRRSGTRRAGWLLCLGHVPLAFQSMTAGLADILNSKIERWVRGKVMAKIGFGAGGVQISQT